MSCAVASAPERSKHPAMSPAPTRTAVSCGFLVGLAGLEREVACCPRVAPPEKATAKQASNAPRSKPNFRHGTPIPVCKRSPCDKQPARIHANDGNSREPFKRGTEPFRKEKEPLSENHYKI